MSTNAHARAVVTASAHEVLVRRAIALTIDGGLLMAIVMVATIPMSLAAMPVVALFLASETLGLIGAALLAVAPGVFLGAGWAWVVALGGGTSPGHRAMRVRVIREDGGPWTFARVAQREVLFKMLLLPLRWGLSLGVLLVVDLVRVLGSTERPLWHDARCGTQVVVAD